MESLSLNNFLFELKKIPGTPTKTVRKSKKDSATETFSSISVRRSKFAESTKSGEENDTCLSKIFSSHIQNLSRSMIKSKYLLKENNVSSVNLEWNQKWVREMREMGNPVINSSSSLKLESFGLTIPPEIVPVIFGWRRLSVKRRESRVLRVYYPASLFTPLFLSPV